MGEDMDLIKCATQVRYFEGGATEKCLLAEEAASVLPGGMKAHRGFAPTHTS